MQSYKFIKQVFSALSAGVSLQALSLFIGQNSEVKMKLAKHRDLKILKIFPSVPRAALCAASRSAPQNAPRAALRANLWRRGAALVVIASLLSALFLASCSSDNSVTRVRWSGKLKVGYVACTEGDCEPFVMSSDGGSEGITATVADKIAANFNASAVFTRFSAEDAYDSLLAGEVDCLWNVSAPDDEYLTSVLTISTGICYRQVIATSADNDEIAQLSDLSGKKLAVVSGSDAQAALDEAVVMKAALSEVVIGDSAQEVLELLDSGEVDCVALSEPQIMYYIAQSDGKYTYLGDTPIAEEELVIAFSAEDAELYSRISSQYSSMLDSGGITEICNQYVSDADVFVESSEESVTDSVSV